MDADKLPYCLCILLVNFFIFSIIIGFQAPNALRNNQDPFSGDLILLFSIILVIETMFFAIYGIKDTD